MITIIADNDVIKDTSFDAVINYFKDSNTQFLLNQFLNQVKDFFSLNPILNCNPHPVIHSIKYRIKDSDHLRDKLKRKKEGGIIVTEENLFKEVTDLAGVRILHLYQEQFEPIHCQIMEKVESNDWCLGEPPKAYTWDPEAKKYFEKLKILTEVKDSYYTSVHYLVKNNNKNSIFCEIQVRTLFEEIWGEIDHAINYPHKIDDIACSEQLKVLSRLVATGTSLSSSIFRTYNSLMFKD